MGLLKKIADDITYGNKITFILRAIMGMMFVFSGFFKALDPETFGKVITMYNIMPEFLVPYPAIVIPFMELILGLFLIVGYKIRPSAMILIILMILFTFSITVNVLRGETFDCNCFELNRLGIGLSENISVKLIIRDMIIIFILVIISLTKKNLFSIDSFIEKFRLRNV